jgi:hypothetical protein
MLERHAAGDARRRFEEKTAALVGLRLTGVSYWDFLSHGTPWDHGDWHHAVMGVELMTDAGPQTVIWTSTFFPYGVEVFPEPGSAHHRRGAGGAEDWTVTAHPRWRGRVGTTIRAASTYWDRVETGPACVAGVRVSDPKEYDVPFALRLDFDAGPVWLMTAMPEWPEMERIRLGGDEIVVVFTPERLRAIGLDPIPGNENSSEEIL